MGFSNKHSPSVSNSFCTPFWISEAKKRLFLPGGPIWWSCSCCLEQARVFSAIPNENLSAYWLLCYRLKQYIHENMGTKVPNGRHATMWKFPPRISYGVLACALLPAAPRCASDCSEIVNGCDLELHPREFHVNLWARHPPPHSSLLSFFLFFSPQFQKYWAVLRILASMKSFCTFSWPQKRVP